MTSESGVIYFNVGTKCLARLVTSLYSLRQHWHGPVSVMNGGMDGGIVERICRDERILAEHRAAAIVHRRKNTAYAAKPAIMRQSPYSVTVFLDADTLVVGGLEELFAKVAGEEATLGVSPGVVLTAFSNWISTGPLIRRRIESMARTSEEAARLGTIALSSPHAAVNTGVVAFRREDPFLHYWERITEFGWNVFIADEMAAQLLTADPAKYPHILVDDRWNASPMYHGCEAGDVRVWHFHGDKHCVRPGGKGAAGHRLWWPAFAEVWAEDVGGVREWCRQAAGDKALRGHIGRLTGDAGEAGATEETGAA